MVPSLALALILLGCETPASAPDWDTVRPVYAEGSGWGYRTDDGTWLQGSDAGPYYDRLDVFANDTALAYVRRGDEPVWMWLEIARDHLVEHPLRCDEVRVTDDHNRVFCAFGGKWGSLSRQGEIYPPRYDRLYPMPGGWAVTSTPKWGSLLDDRGNMVHEAAFVALRGERAVVSEVPITTAAERLHAVRDGRVAMLDPATGRTTPLSVWPTDIRDSAIAYAEEGRHGLDTIDGDPILQAAPRGISLVGEHRALVFDFADVVWQLYFIDYGIYGRDWYTGAVRPQGTFDRSGFQEGRMAVMDPKTGTCGYIDADGNRLFGFLPGFEECSAYHDGRALVGSVSGYRFVDMDGWTVDWR